MVTRREFLAHSGGIGLGAALLPHQGTLIHAAESGPNRPSDNVILEPVKTEGLALISYLVGDRKSGTAAVIDPRRDVDVFLELARKHRLKITHALETHIHADFVSGSRELAARTGTAKVYASVEGGARYGFPSEPLTHNREVDLGRVRLRVLHTPGHTPEHVSYLATEKGAETKPWALFTGDFLFVDSVGRPDLLGAANTLPLARTLYKTLHSAYRHLGDAIRIYPAHGAGSPCGANIAERDSTLGLERMHNPALKIKGEAAFIDWLLASQPPVPYYWPRMKKVNAAGPEVLRGLPTVDWYSPRGFQTLLGKGNVQLIDTRHMLAFGGGHIQGALNLGAKPDLSMWAGWMLDPDRPLALVPGRESDVTELVRWLIRVGYTNFAGALRGGMDAWIQEGLPVVPLPLMTVHQVKKTFPTRYMQLVDVRLPVEWDMGHIPGAQYLFLPELPRKLDRLDRSRPVVVYCASGYRSSIAASLLQKHGFTVYNVPGSFKAWAAAGYPVEKPKKPGRGTDTERS